jgi:hypothetical protein
VDVNSRVQRAVNQRQISDGMFLFLFGTILALALITAEIGLILKHGAVSVYKRVRRVL